jgi:hypothetical protein
LKKLLKSNHIINHKSEIFDPFLENFIFTF